MASRPVLPAKLPPNQRKKLSLIIEPTSPIRTTIEKHELRQSDPFYKRPTDAESILADQFEFQNSLLATQPFDAFRLSNDTYASFQEDKNESADVSSSTTDSNSYYVLNEMLSYEVPSPAFHSDTSNDTTNSPNATLNEQSDDEDEAKYYVPYGLIKQENDFNHFKEETNGEQSDELLNDELNGVAISEIASFIIDSNPSSSSTKVVVTNSNKHPQLPKKLNRREFQNSFRTLKSTSRQPIDSKLIQHKATNADCKNEDEYIYCPPSEQQLFTFESFKRELLRNNSNKKCADCQFNEAKNVTCKYFLTLCDACADLHKKLPHSCHKFYTIDFQSIYSELSKENNNYCDLNTFLSIFNEAGNDKMNSLFEFDSLKADTIRTAHCMSEFIREKYLHKSFINMNEIDYSENYMQILNRTLYIEGICIPVIIYNLFIGANINYSYQCQTVYDIACQAEYDSSQKAYFKLNNSYAYAQMNRCILEQEFEGESVQVYDMNPTIQSPAAIASLPKSKLKLNLNKRCMLLTQTNQRNKLNKTEINYRAIIKVEAHVKSSLIEVKWCHKENNSLVSTYLQYSSLSEKNLWMKEIFTKMLTSLDNVDAIFKPSNTKQNVLSLLDLINGCEVSLIGYLSMDSLEFSSLNEEVEGQPVLAILLESSPLQSANNYFVRKLILVEGESNNSKINEQPIEMIDLRKIRLKLKDNSLIRIDYDQRYVVLRSHGYIQNLISWYDHLLAKSQMSLYTINEQYLTRENVPIFIEKLCSYVEFNFISEKEYYSVTKFVKNNVKSIGLMNKLLKEKGYELNALTDSVNPLNLFKSFFATYFTQKYLVLMIKSFEKLFDNSSELDLSRYLAYKDFTNSKIAFSMLQLNEYSVTNEEPNQEIYINAEKLKSFLFKISQTNLAFYSTLKRISIHLHLITIYKEKNKMNSEYLTDIFVPILFNLQSASLITPVKQFIERLEFKRSFDFASQYEAIIKFYLSKLIRYMIDNCANVFNLKENYLKTQIKMIERSFEMNKINLNRLSVKLDNLKYSITIYIDDKRKEQSFQANIDSETTCMSVLESIPESSSKNMCIVEVLDCEKIRLLRLLPMDLKLIGNLSKWNSFNLCAKKCLVPVQQSESQTRLNLNNQCEKCEIVQLCKNCASSTCQESTHNKWKTCYMYIQNDSIKISKRYQDTDTIAFHQEDHMYQMNKLKLMCEMKMDDTLCYFGLYYKSEGQQASNNKSWTIPNEIKISEDECLTLYDKKTNNIYCVHFQQKQTALDYYKWFYERVHNVNCSGYVSLLEFNSVESIRKFFIWTTETSYSTSSIARMLKKIIKK